jgi:hypothetical protein
MNNKNSRKTKSIDNKKSKKTKKVYLRNIDEENIPEEHSNFSIKQHNFNKISVNLISCIFTYVNLQELFICKNLNKKFRNVIFKNVACLRKYIDLKKFYAFHDERFCIREESVFLNKFYNEWLLENISVGEINHVLSEFLVEKLYKLKFFSISKDITNVSELELKLLGVLLSSYKCPILDLYVNLNEVNAKFIEEIFRKMKKVESLDIIFENFYNFNYSGVLSALEENKSIKKLELYSLNHNSKSTSSYFHKNFESLFRALMKNKSIEDFSGFITNEVQKDNSLYQSLKDCFNHNKTIKNLTLEGIFSQGQKLNFEFLYQNSTIKSLHIKGSYCLISLSKLFSDDVKIKSTIDSLAFDFDKEGCYESYELEEEGVEDSKGKRRFIMDDENKKAINSCVGNNKLLKLCIYNNSLWKYISPISFSTSVLKSIRIENEIEYYRRPKPFNSLVFLTILRSAKTLESVYIEDFFIETRQEDLERAVFDLLRENTNLKEFKFTDLNDDCEERVRKFLIERKMKAIAEIKKVFN